MARIALVKIFTGLNLGVAQLSGELQRAGHESLMIFFKDYFFVPANQMHRYAHAEYGAVVSMGRAEDWCATCYEPLSEREFELLVQTLRAFEPDLIGFSLTTAGIQMAAEVTERLREHFDVPIIWGGSGPSVEPDETLKSADLVCTFEGEMLILAMAERLDRGEPLHNLHGLWARVGDRIVKNPNLPNVPLDEIAIPDFAPSRTVRISEDKVESNKLLQDFVGNYVIMTSRGCPFSCSFCVESVYQDRFGKKASLRRRSVDLVVEELVEARKKFGFTQVLFFDDVFTTHRRWLEEFAPKYKREVGLPFWCYTYPTTTRREDIELLRDAGCVSMTMGIQSGSQRLLTEYFNRPTPLDRIVEAANIIVTAGVRLMIDIITHVEFEKEEDARANFELLARLPSGTSCSGFAHMKSYPTYGYTAAVARLQAKPELSDADYDYWHRMYFLALSELPYGVKRAVLESPIYRKCPELIDAISEFPRPFMSFFEPRSRAEAVRRRVVNSSYGQAVIPDHLKDVVQVVPQGPAPAPAIRKRLPMFT